MLSSVFPSVGKQKNERDGRVFSSYRRIQARKAAGEIDESGFTLIELLIVIVVLGILAGVVIFALGGVTGQSAVAACKADGATVNTAIAAFNTDNSGTTVTQALLLGNTDSGPFLQSWPSNAPHYAFTIDASGVLQIAVPSSGVAANYTGPSSCNTVV
jgi:general secretion pathway protein G